MTFPIVLLFCCFVVLWFYGFMVFFQHCISYEEIQCILFSLLSIGFVGEKVVFCRNLIVFSVFRLKMYYVTITVQEKRRKRKGSWSILPNI